MSTFDPADGISDPFFVEVEGEVGPVREHHYLNVYWNTRGQLLFYVWNQLGGVQGAGAKALTISEVRSLIAWLKRTVEIADSVFGK